MNRFKIKVCGMTRPADAALAAKLGVDMIGMIFYRPSPRFVSLKIASEITRVLSPTVARVGVFVNAETDRILRVAERLCFDYVQLSGDEPASQIIAMKKSGLKVIKSFTVSCRRDFAALYKSRADLVMLDNRSGFQYGGTGAAFDWKIKPPQPIDNLMLAGGINGSNVADGVKMFRPLVVDVNSGVEKSTGVKSARKLKQFFKMCDVLRYGAKV